MIWPHCVPSVFAAWGGVPALLALALLGGPGVTAHADIVFSNLGPNGSSDSSGGYAFGDVFPNTIQDIAAFFRVGSQAFSLQEIDVGMGLMSTPNRITLELLPDVKGAPGPDSQALESFQVVNKLPFTGSNAPAVPVGSVLHPLLEANTGYWIVAAAAQPTEAIWNSNDVLYGGGTFAYRVNDGSWEVVANDMSPAFAVLGSPVPEPATLSLLGIAALGLLVFKCRLRLCVVGKTLHRKRRAISCCAATAAAASRTSRGAAAISRRRSTARAASP
jgi:hypothetical protein